MSIMNNVPRSFTDLSAAESIQTAKQAPSGAMMQAPSTFNAPANIQPKISLPMNFQEIAENHMENILLRKKSHEKLRHCAFSPEEDANLRELILIHGETNWKKISLSMFRRSARQCRERWSVLKKREESKRPWTEEEDTLLVQKCIQLGPKWGKIELFFTGRDSQSLKNRWKLLTKNQEIDSLMMSSEQDQFRTEISQEESNQEEVQNYANNQPQSRDSSSIVQVNSGQSEICSFSQTPISQPKDAENFDFAFWDFMNFNNDDNPEDLFSFCW